MITVVVLLLLDDNSDHILGMISCTPKYSSNSNSVAGLVYVQE
jgi:hypothetical protein